MNGSSRKAHSSRERWLVSYADFITLLFAFFVVLYSASKADQRKQLQVSASINSAFRSLGIFAGVNRVSNKVNGGDKGVDTPAIPMNIVMGEDLASPAKVQQDLNQMRRDLEQRLSNQIAQHTVSIQMGRGGLVISLREAGFFGSGSATPGPETLVTLRQVAASLDHTHYDLRIEGHTDNVPIHNGEFDSNWELSTARATRIARLFLELDAMPAEQVSAAGYAEFHPEASNETAEGRAKNRRVDLVVLPRTRIDLSSSDLSTPGVPRSSGAWRKITDEDRAP
jgi:chemotaxis protein MotB